MIIFNFLTYLYLILGSVFIFPIIMLTNLCNCTWFNLFWNFALFMLHFILHIFFSFYCCCCCCCFIGKRLINFYSQKWNTWWWNNCEMKELGTTQSCYNSFPWIGFIKFWNHLANSLFIWFTQELDYKARLTAFTVVLKITETLCLWKSLSSRSVASDLETEV